MEESQHCFFAAWSSGGSHGRATFLRQKIQNMRRAPSISLAWVWAFPVMVKRTLTTKLKFSTRTRSTLSLLRGSGTHLYWTLVHKFSVLRNYTVDFQSWTVKRKLFISASRICRQLGSHCANSRRMGSNAKPTLYDKTRHILHYVLCMSRLPSPWI